MPGAFLNETEGLCDPSRSDENFVLPRRKHGVPEARTFVERKLPADHILRQERARRCANRKRSPCQNPRQDRLVDRFTVELCHFRFLAPIGVGAHSLRLVLCCIRFGPKWSSGKQLLSDRVTGAREFRILVARCCIGVARILHPEFRTRPPSSPTPPIHGP